MISLLIASSVTAVIPVVHIVNGEICNISVICLVHCDSIASVCSVTTLADGRVNTTGIFVYHTVKPCYYT